MWLRYSIEIISTSYRLEAGVPQKDTIFWSLLYVNFRIDFPANTIPPKSCPK